MIEDSQVKGKYFSSMTLEDEVVIKSFREDDLRLSFRQKGLIQKIFLLLFFNKHLLYTCVFWACPSTRHVRSSYKTEFLLSRLQ